MASGLPDRFLDSSNTSVLDEKVDDWTYHVCRGVGSSEYGPHSVTLHCADSHSTASLAVLTARFTQFDIERVCWLFVTPSLVTAVADFWLQTELSQKTLDGAYALAT